jgi:subtilisin family serine protease
MYENQFEFIESIDEELYKNSNNLEIIVKFTGSLDPLKKDLNAYVEILSTNYAIVTIDKNLIPKLTYYPQVQYIEKPKLLYSSQTDPLVSSCIKTVQTDTNLKVSGTGVLLSIIDSGIDYTHRDFRLKDGTTRIDSIWDLSQNGNPPTGFKKGTLYLREEINHALTLKNPLEKLPQQDFIGHGTNVAGVACGNGNSSSGETKGVATDATLTVVKLDYRKASNGVANTDLMRGVKFAYNRAILLNMPLVINLSFGTNDGCHDGRSLFETYLDEMSQLWKSSIVVASGNEGSSGHHYYNKLKESESALVEFTTMQTLTKLSLSLWKSFIDKFDFELISPEGTSIGKINYLDTSKKFVYKNTTITVLILQPTFYNTKQEVYFNFTAISGFINDGLWAIKVVAKSIVVGDFNIWLPTTEAVSTKTAFLNPSVDTTLTIPSTSSNVITVGGYNSTSNSIADFSGRGNLTDINIIKPDIVAPSVNILTTKSGGGYTPVSGTSFASPQVAGAVALLMEFGIVKNNSPFLYGEKIKSYLHLGAKRNTLIDYPNKYWGFGTLCLKNSFDALLEQSPTKLINSMSFNFAETNLGKYNLGQSILLEKCYQYMIKYNTYVASLLLYKKYIIDYTILHGYYAVVYIDKSEALTFAKDFDCYILYDKPINFSSNEVKHNFASYLDIADTNILLGFIYSSINFTNHAFIHKDGTSKILNIWNQGVFGKPPAYYKFGEEYLKGDIDTAMPLESHLHITKQVNATFNANTILEGYINTYPNADIIGVKLKSATPLGTNNRQTFDSCDIALAVDYLYKKSIELNLPIIICLELGSIFSNDNYDSLFFKYLHTISKHVGVYICIPDITV